MLHTPTPPHTLPVMPGGFYTVKMAWQLKHLQFKSKNKKPILFYLLICTEYQLWAKNKRDAEMWTIYNPSTKISLTVKKKIPCRLLVQKQRDTDLYTKNTNVHYTTCNQFVMKLLYFSKEMLKAKGKIPDKWVETQESLTKHAFISGILGMRWC